MITALQDAYGNLTSEEIQALKMSLSSSRYASTSAMSEHVTVHVLIHQDLAAAHQPLTEFDKTSYFIHSIKDSGLFAFALNAFALEFPRPEQRTFARISAAIQAAADERPSAATAGAAGYAHDLQLSAALEEIARLKAAAPKPRPPPTPAQIALNAEAYCWTHGDTRSSRHTSATCRTRKPGHIETASRVNKCGGK